MSMSEFVEPSGWYGRIWASMYEGSLAGSGPEVFCLMPYVIAKMRMKDGKATVLLNPKVLAPIFGVKDENFVVVGIEKLCAPDPLTQNGKEQEGKRLIHVEGHLYEVVNGAAYMAIRAKERHADAQARYRERTQQKKKKGKRGEPLPGEALYERTGEMPHEFREGDEKNPLPEPPKVNHSPVGHPQAQAVPVGRHIVFRPGGTIPPGTGHPGG